MTSKQTKYRSQKHQVERLSSSIKLGKLIAAVSVAVQLNGCFDTQHSGNQYSGDPQKLAVSENNSEDHIRFLIPKEVLIPKNVRVLSCVPVDKGSIEGFKNYLASGKGREIYAIPYANYPPNQTITVIAYEGADKSFCIIVLAGDGTGINSATGKHFALSFNHLKSARDFLWWRLICRAGRYDLLADLYNFLRIKQNENNYYQTLKELTRYAKVLANATEEEPNPFSILRHYPSSRQGREFGRVIDDLIENITHTLVVDSPNNKVALDVVFLWLVVKIEQGLKSGEVTELNLRKWIEESLKDEHRSPEAKELIRRLLSYLKNEAAKV